MVAGRIPRELDLAALFSQHPRGWDNVYIASDILIVSLTTSYPLIRCYPHNPFSWLVVAHFLTTLRPPGASPLPETVWSFSALPSFRSPCRARWALFTSRA
jgi:hypothetical protein